jgi:hypothetical protein
MDNSAKINSLIKKMEAMRDTERSSAELLSTIQDSILRNRMRPRDLSQLYIVSICQKLTKLEDVYDDLAAKAADAMFTAREIDPK